MPAPPPRPPARRDLTVRSEDAGGRVDAWLAAQSGLSRARIQQLIAVGAVLLDDTPLADPSRRVRAGMRAVLEEPPDREPETLPQDIPFPILFEDAELLVLDKPAGLVVHPAPGHPDGTLVNAILHHCGDLGGIGGERRPGIVHRLDRDTSGVMVVAKTQRTLDHLQHQFQEGQTRKLYRALVHGLPSPPAGRIETQIGRSPRDRKRMAVLPRGGRRALTFYQVLETFGASDAADLEVRIETGRTHQIRVHLHHLGHPVLGDPVYGRPRRDRTLLPGAARQLLHAWRLSLLHPRTGARLDFEAPLPADFLAAREALREKL